MKFHQYWLKTSVLLSALLITTSYSGLSHALDINGFTLSGDERVGWLEYDYSNPNGLGTINKGHKDSKGFYAIPKISLETPTHKGFKAKITGAAATDFGLNDEDKQERLFVFDGADNETFSILQELYVEYADDKHNVIVGRNEITTPMIDADDYYMLANSFEIVRYINSSFKDTDIHIGYFGKMAGVWDSGANGTEFNSMSDASFVSGASKSAADDSGILYGAIDFNNDTHHAQLWNYHAEDLYNTIFAQYNYLGKSDSYSYDAGAQIIDFSELGSLKDFEEIDYSIYSLKYDGSFDNGYSFATGFAKYTDGDGQGSTLGAWGGYPYFANGMIFHFFESGNLRDASSYKFQGALDLSKYGVDGMSVAMRYTHYALESQYSISSGGQGQDAAEMYGVQLKYKFLSDGYFTGTFEQHDIDHEPTVWALRLIGGYKF